MKECQFCVIRIWINLKSSEKFFYQANSLKINPKKNFTAMEKSKVISSLVVFILLFNQSLCLEYNIRTEVRHSFSYDAETLLNFFVGFIQNREN